MHRRSQSRTRDIVSLGGWLFADLLLALTMLFFISGVVVSTPVKVAPTPTPISQPRLELHHLRINITIDPYGILQNNAAAIKNVEQQLQARTELHHHNAGLVIAYGGAPYVGQVSTALAIADKMYAILKDLGRQRYVFGRAVYYDPLYELGGSQSIVILDIYLFAQ
ncbi:MAG TPA: hypothetical protein VKR42_11550 [Ktedonobacteraceae bacterium]|nr:hypothetical protein [Ktedonobacteraceae bacterium]